MGKPPTVVPRGLFFAPDIWGFNFRLLEARKMAVDKIPMVELIIAMRIVCFFVISYVYPAAGCDPLVIVLKDVVRYIIYGLSATS